MNRTFTLLLVLLIKSTLLFSQGLYFKASSNYNFSMNSQHMPEYFTYHISAWGPVGGYDINLSVNEFSIASGFNPQCAIGYSFNDYFSLELDFSAFRNTKKEFDALPFLEYNHNGRTEWEFHSYSLMPKILFGHSFKKSSVNIFFFSGYGTSKLNIKASIDELFRVYEFNSTKIFCWGYGLEYSYSLFNNFNLISNIGINNSSYSPNKAKIVSSSTPIEYLNTSQKEIVYVDEVTNLDLSLLNWNSPEIRLKETLRLNGLYLGIGIKYILIRK